MNLSLLAEYCLCVETIALILSPSIFVFSLLHPIIQDVEISGHNSKDFDQVKTTDPTVSLWLLKEAMHLKLRVPTN